jgi:hypothetical protein
VSPHLQSSPLTHSLELSPAPRIARLENSTSDRYVTLQLSRSRLAPVKDRIRVNPSVTSAKVATRLSGGEDGNGERMDPSPYSASSIDLTSSSEFCENGRSWKSLLNATRVAMTSCLSLSPKLRSRESGAVRVTGSMRVSQLATPLHRTWYKERGGWRWVEKDAGEVLDELRKLQ